jgi:hypothetical protein
MSSQRVVTRLFLWGRSDTADNASFLTPQGTIILQRVGFPIDVAHCTCIPKGPVALFHTAIGPNALETQWYQPSHNITEIDIPRNLSDTPIFKDAILHYRRPDPHTYPLTSVTVDDEEVQWLGFLGKRIVYRRLGHAVEIDLSEIANNQTFTVSAEWDVDYIELRVTWLTGNGGLGAEGSGLGIKYADLENYLASYKLPDNAKVVRYTERAGFEAALVPASVIRAIWASAKDTIADQETSGTPEQRVGALRKSYENEEDFCNTVMDVITEIQRILPKTRPHAFWDDKTPKREPESGNTLRLLFEEICAYKNIRISQEDPGRSGDVDLVFSGISKQHEHLQVIMEIKNAHSDKLERGLTHQLPQYLAERGANKGIYAILWFKGRLFDKPVDADAAACLRRVIAIMPPVVSGVVLFDVSFRQYASQL